jgi:hypothetical protein
MRSLRLFFLSSTPSRSRSPSVVAFNLMMRLLSMWFIFGIYCWLYIVYINYEWVDQLELCLYVRDVWLNHLLRIEELKPPYLCIKYIDLIPEEIDLPIGGWSRECLIGVIIVIWWEMSLLFLDESNLLDLFRIEHEVLHLLLLALVHYNYLLLMHFGGVAENLCLAE